MNGSRAGPEPVPSLFLSEWGTNAGYAIAPLETTFYTVCLEIAGGDESKVHFGYPNLDRGHPRSLPQNFQNVASLDFTDTAEGGLERIAAYVRDHGIRLVWIFDIQPVHPLFKRLRKAGARTIVAYWGAPISSRMPSWKLLLKKLQVATSRSKLDGLIFESRAMADLAIFGRGVPRRMIDVVPLGIDISRFKPDRTDYAHRTFGIPATRRIVVYAGHVNRRKGVHVLVEAAAELLGRRGRSDMCFLICGNVDDQSKEFERLYEGLGVDEWIRFIGYRSDLPEIYRSCLCGVIPSTGWDSFPRTSVEMAASGLPVVASRLDGLPEAVLDKQTGLLFEPGNAAALADALEVLVDHPEVAAQYGRRGRERCEAELNLEVQRTRLLAVLRRYLSR